MCEAVIFDAEFTAWDGSMRRNWTAPGEFREIVQIGAICVDVAHLVERRSFEALVRPVLNPVLSNYFVTLTGIQQAAIDAHGVTLAQAVAQFRAFAGSRALFCYGRDEIIIRKNQALLGDAVSSDLRASNIGLWFAQHGVNLGGLHSGDLAKAVGAGDASATHQAIADCRSILIAVRVLVAQGAPNPFLPQSGREKA